MTAVIGPGRVRRHVDRERRNILRRIAKRAGRSSLPQRNRLRLLHDRRRILRERAGAERPADNDDEDRESQLLQPFDFQIAELDEGSRRILRMRRLQADGACRSARIVHVDDLGTVIEHDDVVAVQCRLECVPLAGMILVPSGAFCTFTMLPVRKLPPVRSVSSLSRICSS